MDLRTATISCIERMPDTEESERVLKHMYAMAKKAGKETRCAKKRKDRDSYLPDLREEFGAAIVRNRLSR